MTMHPGLVVSDRFEIERKAASGGMGTVYRALDRSSGQVVALKVLSASLESERDRFVREVRVLSELRHPAIVRYVADGQTPDGSAWLAMEWLDGETLAERASRGLMEVDDVLAIGSRIAQALAAAHGRGIVHRDVKPGNVILVDGDPALATLIDFGVVRAAWGSFGRGTPGDAEPTRTGVLIGTPQYMSPEQARGRGQIDARSDVFSLACVLYRCLTGRPPFAAEDFLSVLARLLLEEAPRLRSCREDAPVGLDELLARMLSKGPLSRPADGGVVVAELALLRDATLREPVAPSDRSPAHETLTDAEQRVLSVVLAQSPSELPGLDDLFALYKARPERFLDGTLLVALEGKGSATDSAGAAARCALAIAERLRDATVVLATGRAVVSRAVTVGEVIERAVRLLRGSDPSPNSSRRRSSLPIRIDDVTAGLLDRRFNISAGGAEGTSLLLGVRETEQTGRTLLGKPTSFVGRDRELSILLGIFDEAVSEPVARVALVTAPAGMGKSRLRYEVLRRLAQRAEAYTLFFGRGDALRIGSPYSLLAPPLREAASIVEAEALDEKRAKLLQRVSRSVPEADARRVSEFLGEMIDVPFPDQDSIPLRSARRDAMLMADQTRRAFEDFLAGELGQTPVLVVLEDLHWADPPSVGCIDAALRRFAERPLMVLAFARPEISEAFPALWRGHHVQPVPLAALGRRAGAQLVREVLGESVDPSDAERIVERASGNVFYLEELIRATAEGKGDALPDTVLAMVQARLSTLDPEGRRVLRAASLFGDVFWGGGVRVLVDDAGAVQHWLNHLVVQELIAPRGHSRFPEEHEYRFRHALVREAAYAMLTEADRVHGHALAGAWLERMGEHDAALLADHFQRGGEAGRAARWFADAAEQALEASDLSGAIARANSGISCGADGQLLGRLRLAEALANQWMGKWAETESCARAALHELPRGSRRWCIAAEQAIYGLGKMGRYDDLGIMVEALADVTPDEDAGGAYAIALGRGSWFLVHACRFEPARAVLARLEELTAEIPSIDMGAAAQIDAIRAGHALYAEDWEACVALSQSAIQRFEMAGDPRGVSMQLVFMADAYKELGAYDQAEGIFREAIAAASRMGLQIVTALAKMNLSLVLAYSGCAASALGLAHDAVVAYSESGDHRLQVCAKSYQATALELSGDGAAAENVAREAVALPCRSPPTRAYAEGTLAGILLARGKTTEALAFARAAFSVLQDLGRIEEGDSLVRLVYAESLHGAGETAAAREALTEARERLLQRAGTLRDPGLREVFLRRVPHHARTLALAEAWGLPKI